MANFSKARSAGQPINEAYTGGPLDGLSVTNTYDALHRRTALATLVNSNSQLPTPNSQPLTSTSYSYDLNPAHLYAEKAHFSSAGVGFRALTMD